MMNQLAEPQEQSLSRFEDYVCMREVRECV